MYLEKVTVKLRIGYVSTASDIIVKSMMYALSEQRLLAQNATTIWAPVLPITQQTSYRGPPSIRRLDEDSTKP